MDRGSCMPRRASTPVPTPSSLTHSRGPSATLAARYALSMVRPRVCLQPTLRIRRRASGSCAPDDEHERKRFATPAVQRGSSLAPRMPRVDVCGRTCHPSRRRDDRMRPAYQPRRRPRSLPDPAHHVPGAGANRDDMEVASAHLDDMHDVPCDPWPRAHRHGW